MTNFELPIEEKLLTEPRSLACRVYQCSPHVTRQSAEREKQLGQAKLKGSFEQRQTQAIANARAQFPTSIKCNNCGNDLTEIQPMNVRGMQGMRLAGGAICASCSQTTWVLDGTPEALAQMQAFLDEEHGDEAKIGFAKKPQSNS